MRIAIVDDEALARERLAALLVELGGHEVVAQAANGVEALAVAQALAPEVMLLDIRMPRMDGLEAARHLACLPAPPAVVFTTAYGEHALAAFDAQAVDYLLKPVRRERLAQALARAAALRPAALERLAEALASARTVLSAVQRGRLVFAPVPEVRALVADHKYVTVHWPGGELLLDESLKNLEQEFGERFLRVHRNALVAPAHVAALERDDQGDWQLRLRGLPLTVRVSRRLLADVRRRLR